MQDCIFCKIVNEEILSYRIDENEDFLAFLDISQIAKGHTLVIPKTHYQFMWDVPNMGEYFEFIKNVGNHFLSLGYKYVDTITMGRQIPHSHVHIIPHNADNNDWQKALKPIFQLQLDEDRRLNADDMQAIQQEFQLS